MAKEYAAALKGSYCPKCLRRFKGQSIGTHATKCVVSQIELFWTRVEKTDDCWLYHGGKKQDGYGLLRIKEKMIQAHRLSWEIAYGPVPEGMCVLHKCDTPACVNPDHLFIGDRKLNGEDMASKGRSLHGERSHHAKLTAEQVAEIRRLLVWYNKRRTNAQDLAKVYGVSTGAILHAASGRTWKRL